MEEAEGLRNGFLRARGIDWDTLDDATRALVGARLVVGDADTAGERIQQLWAWASTGSPSTCPPTATTPTRSPTPSV